MICRPLPLVFHQPTPGTQSHVAYPCSCGWRSAARRPEQPDTLALLKAQMAEHMAERREVAT